ncbi:hypothetical protein DL766_001064 [Monosporascus sp. MC13-8B]|nr:hypothetical protein DL763_002065 [Monosporascus cannonballus]RYP38269.1 hypothetical protein DL766_001064 [Monosporascus sp. MC13-8B]
MVRSLALEFYGRSSSGTVTFRDVPAALKALRPKKTWDLTLRSGPGMRSECLSLDADFLGMTILFAPPDEDQSRYDLRSGANDQLMARIMTYGYESTVAGSQSIRNLEDLATSFQTSLRSLAAGPTSRPVIFVAHSLGGLIVKQTAKSEDEDDKKLMQAVYGIVFFGVPHDGMDISSLIPMVGDGPNRFLIESISQINSQILPIQRREFHTALGDKGRSEIVCFYETMKSPTAQKDEKGNWAMNGPPAVLVSKTSATHCRSWEDGPEHICAVARTNSEMVKFGCNDHDYENVRERLRGLAHRAVSGRRRQQALGTKLKDWLVKIKGPWLMVIDKCHDTDIFFRPSSATSDGGEGNLGQFLPECSYGALLITTRNKQTGVKLAKRQPPIDVGPAAFIQENSITVQDLELQDESDQSLVNLLSEEFETAGRDSETPREGIPEAFISNYGKRNNRFDGRIELVKAVGVLKAFSLVSKEKGSNLDMHWLVQLVTLKWLTKEGTAGHHDREALLTVSEMYPFGEFEIRAICSAYLPHANVLLNLEICASEEEAEAKAKASLLHRMARYLYFEGKKVLGKDHPNTLISMHSLAWTWHDSDQRDKAIPLMEDCIRRRQQILGRDHPDTQSSEWILKSWQEDLGASA